MLCLGVGDQYWLEKLAKFEDLQILTVRNFETYIPRISSRWFEEIAKCRHLQAVDVFFHELHNVEMLQDIARGCPLLRKLSVRQRHSWVEPELAENLCISLLHSLPRLEHLELYLKFRIDGEGLQQLARQFPQLTILLLPRARLCLSLALLTEAPSFRHLEMMRLAFISFDDPRRLMQLDKVQALAAEWSRAFPKLRGIPCPPDFYSRYMQEDEADEDRISESADEEMSPSEPERDYDDYGSDYFILRTKLWKALGYSVIDEKIQNMWQSNLEIKTVGWPVRPLMAFSNPDAHSTSTR